MCGKNKLIYSNNTHLTNLHDRATTATALNIMDHIPRVVPWMNWNEWMGVYNSLFSLVR